MSQRSIARLRRMRQAARAGHDPSVCFPVPSGRDVTPRVRRKEVSDGEVKFHPPAPFRTRACTLMLKRRDPWERDMAAVRKEFSR